MGSSLNGKNLLPEEQILSIKSCPQLKKGGKTDTGRVVSPEIGSIYLNMLIILSDAESNNVIGGIYLTVSIGRD